MVKTLPERVLVANMMDGGGGLQGMRGGQDVCKASMLGLVVLVVFSLGAAAKDPIQTNQGSDSRGSKELVLCQEGLLIETHSAAFQRMRGPLLPGEPSFMGSFVPGLLSVSGQRELSDCLVGKWRPRSLPQPSQGVGDRFVIVLDPGHGGSQVGAVGVSGMKEKDLVLDVARRTSRAFKSDLNVEIVMTRLQDEDISLQERVELANQLKADVFVSIHANAFVRSILGGVETFFHSIEASGEEAQRVASAENAVGIQGQAAVSDPVSMILEDMQRAEKLRDSSRLAHLVQARLASNLPFENRGVMQADFVVLGGTRMPSILIELGFLTNPKEEKALRDSTTRDRIAGAIRQGILEYWAVVRSKTVHLSKGAGIR